VHGTWTAQLLFPDAPPDIRQVACTYVWEPSPTSPGAAPDANHLLEALDASHVTRSEAPVSCEPAATERLPVEASAALLPPPDPLTPPIGVTGCDVCARLGTDGRAYVILPDYNLRMLDLVTKTTEGRFVTFAMTPPRKDAQVFAAALPAVPGGLDGVGSVSVFERP